MSYPESLGAWRAGQLRRERFVNYLRKTLGEVSEGDEFEEFVDVGCCGSSPDIPLVVEAVEGGALVGPETAIEFVARGDGEDGDSGRARLADVWL